ncbi:MAG TPA: hypothetical protein VF590_27535 [Isosphaeraceae bacterium]
MAHVDEDLLCLASLISEAEDMIEKAEILVEILDGTPGMPDSALRVLGQRLATVRRLLHGAIPSEVARKIEEAGEATTDP